MEETIFDFAFVMVWALRVILFEQHCSISMRRTRLILQPNPLPLPTPLN